MQLCKNRPQSHQAVCLLANVAVLDNETFNVLLNLDEFHLELNLKIQKADMFHDHKNVLGQQDFRDFVTFNFPIPGNKTHLIRNLDDELRRAIENKDIPNIKKPIKGINKTLLDPSRVIHWAIHNEIEIPQSIMEGISERRQEWSLHFP